MAINKDFVVKHGISVNAAATFSNTISVAGNTTLGGGNTYLTSNLHVNAALVTRKSEVGGNTTISGNVSINLAGAGASAGQGNAIVISANNSQVLLYAQGGSNTLFAVETNHMAVNSTLLDIKSANLVANAPVATSSSKIGTNSRGNRTLTTTTPSGGTDGDIWYQY